MKKILQISSLFLFLFFAQSAYAVSEICDAGVAACPDPPDASVCLAPPIIQNAGGCPVGYAWISNAGAAGTGECAIPNVCVAGTDEFHCSTNTCWNQPIPGPPATCSQADVNTGSSLPCCTDDQVTVRDSTYPTGWKCEDKPVYLRDAVDGVIDFLEALMTELGVDNTVKANIITALTNLADGNPANLAAALAAFAIPPPPSDDYFGVYTGSTSSAYNGSQGGYEAANAYCQADHPGSHICTASEMINSYNNTPGPITGLAESVWVNNGPPGYVVYRSNDCNGWQLSDSAKFGSVWDGVQDASFVTPCNMTRKYACCM